MTQQRFTSLYYGSVGYHFSGPSLLLGSSPIKLEVSRSRVITQKAELVLSCCTLRNTLLLHLVCPQQKPPKAFPLICNPVHSALPGTGLEETSHGSPHSTLKEMKQSRAKVGPQHEQNNKGHLPGMSRNWKAEAYDACAAPCPASVDRVLSSGCSVLHPPFLLVHEVLKGLT